MKVRLICVGKGMPSWIGEGVDVYAKRLRPELDFQLCEISAAAGSKSQTRDQIREREGRSILSMTDSQEFFVALDERGKRLDSVAFSRLLQDILQLGQKLVFVIGGAEGLSQDCRERADYTLSLSPLTFPHMLVRVILLEQLYRGLSILRNHPYHRS